MNSKVKKSIFCRGCHSKKMSKVLSLGKSPLANSFLRIEELEMKEAFFSLYLNLCKNCGLVQLADVVNPDLMFKNYLYVSSTSKSFVKHFEKFAGEIYKRFHLNSKDLVIDVGSNDGILLKPLKKLGINVLGVDPAENVVRIAKKNGVNTICGYFNVETAKNILKKYGKAKVITATNVFAHTDDWDKLIVAVKIALLDEGVFIIEAPYLVDFIEKNLFDTIYHEHLSYIAIRPLVTFFKKHYMEIFDVKRVASHGGSVRIFVKRLEANYRIKPAVKDLTQLEIKKGLDKKMTYLNFARRIKKNKKNLKLLLRKIKTKKKKIVGYGAPAKGNTLLNYFGIGPETMDYIVDDSPLKQGLYTPGTHIPVLSPAKLKADDIDFLFILAWNFADSIIENNSFLREKDVKFIVPVPVPKIVN